MSMLHDDDADTYQKRLQTYTYSQWQDIGMSQTLALFHRAAVDVPAYKQFLAIHGIDHERIVSKTDFEQVPLMTKENYIRAYPVQDRCWNGVLGNQTIVAKSSGTTSSPTYWPRSVQEDHVAGVLHQVLFNTFFAATTK